MSGLSSEIAYLLLAPFAANCLDYGMAFNMN